MAKRGRPSNKTLKKRKVARKKAKRILFLGIIFIVALLALGYYLTIYKGYKI